MDHGLELISHILEILDRTIHTQSYPGNSGSYDPCISPILEVVDRTIHIISFLQVVNSPDEQGGGSGGDSPPVEIEKSIYFFLGVSSEAELR